MRDINASDAIVPLVELKAKATEIIPEICGSDEPVIAQDGRPAAVLVSPSAFQQLRDGQEFLEAVAEGLGDAEAGRVVDHKKVRLWLESWGSDPEGKSPK